MAILFHPFAAMTSMSQQYSFGGFICCNRTTSCGQRLFTSSIYHAKRVDRPKEEAMSVLIGRTRDFPPTRRHHQKSKKQSKVELYSCYQPDESKKT